MTATQREGLSDAALALTQPVIDELLKDIARRIKDAGAITDTAEYQIYRAQALGESKQAIKAAVARQIKAQDKVIDSLFDYILDNSTPLTANGSLKQIAEGYAKMSRQKTAEQLKNLWADTPQGKVLPIQDAYAKALDFAFRQTAIALCGAVGYVLAFFLLFNPGEYKEIVHMFLSKMKKKIA